ncbi:hypothetical protein FRUB_02126 [Fimbriiglobus ruber]|uniref:Uncharacterized protein n=2 Tax=Fimbriiglobus ruber TaxID=1908690 RepID=A0A225EB91_9BACT|nr:hypothetical protein FRUB_02126 [Fimbriiglobus ruber]
MRRDAYLAALEQERVLPLTRWPWEVEVDPDDIDPANPKDPHSEDRERVRRLLQACCRRTPSLSQLVTALGSAVFFGRSGAQLAWTQDEVAGEPRWVVRAWEPVHGDAIQYDWDGTPGITIRPGDTGAFPRRTSSCGTAAPSSPCSVGPTSVSASFSMRTSGRRPTTGSPRWPAGPTGWGCGTTCIGRGGSATRCSPG